MVASYFRFFSAISCALVLATASTNMNTVGAESGGGIKGATGGAQISLPELYADLRNESVDFYKHHMALMFTISGYGDRLYNTDIDISAEGRTTIRAVTIMLGQLRIFQEMQLLVTDALYSSAADVKNATEFLSHPLDLVCRRLKTSIAEKAHLSAAFESAKISVGLKGAESGPIRPAYADKIIDSFDTLGSFLVKRMSIPGIARSLANAAFRHQLNQQQAHSKRHYLLVAAVEAVARKNEFGDAMQSIYTKTLDEMVLVITKNDRVVDVKEAFWFFPQLARKIYGFIAQNPTLKAEFESTAATIGKGFDKSDLDFSTL